MNSNFDIEKLDRQMPYRVPEDFFKHSYDSIMAATVNKAERKKAKIRRLFATCTAVASAAVVATAFFTLQREMPADTMSDEQLSAHIETMVNSLSDEELDNWAECTDPDMYLASY